MLVAAAATLGVVPAAQAAGLTMNPQADPPHAVVNKFYNQSFDATPDDGVAAQYTYEGTGSLPDGLHFGTGANAASILGTPTTALQSTQFTITAHDAMGRSGSRTYNITVDLFDSSPPPQQPDPVTQVVTLVDGLAYVALCPVCNPAVITSTINTLLTGSPPSANC